ncbi:MAG: PH domain-containing protein [Bryobacteraceae bacterium]
MNDESAPVPAYMVRPTAKFFASRALFAAILAVAGLGVWQLVPAPWWVAATAASVGLLYIVSGLPDYSRTRFTKLLIEGDRLRHHEGVLSKTSRSLFLNKIQDVRVVQGLGERIFNIGTISIETAGETSRLEMRHIDNPHAVADKILSLARQFAPQQQPPVR